MANYGFQYRCVTSWFHSLFDILCSNLRKDLEILFGKEEGGRLDSQITLSRNQTKYTQVDNKFRGFFKILFSYFNFFVYMSRH